MGASEVQTPGREGGRPVKGKRGRRSGPQFRASGGHWGWGGVCGHGPLKFVQVKEMVPELVVPELAGFRLKPYVNYRAPEGTDAPLTAKQLFLEAVAPAIEKDFKAGTFDPERLEKYGFEPTQEGKLFQLYPKNFPR
ncbi:39S ribosomal protein L41, mitochondrial [Camelus ferus]|nr:39S ribosomal protein L41, mitochondrial [Camelus ferus]